MTIGLAALSVFMLGFAVYYLRAVARRPQLIYQRTPQNQELIDRLPRLTSRFWVTPWLFNGHLQLLGLGLKKVLSPRLRYDRVDTLRMRDGGTTALHWLGADLPAEGADLPAEVPTLVVLHTIIGSPHSMRGFMRDLQRAVRAPGPRGTTADQSTVQHHGRYRGPARTTQADHRALPSVRPLRGRHLGRHRFVDSLSRRTG